MCTQSFLSPLTLPLSLSLSITASSLLCDQPLIYDMIASAMCLRGTHKSTSSLLNTRARQGQRPTYTAKNVHLNKSFHLVFRLKILFLSKLVNILPRLTKKSTYFHPMLIFVFQLFLLSVKAEHFTNENDTLFPCFKKIWRDQ